MNLIIQFLNKFWRGFELLTPFPLATVWIDIIKLHLFYNCNRNTKYYMIVLG